MAHKRSLARLPVCRKTKTKAHGATYFASTGRRPCKRESFAVRAVRGFGYCVSHDGLVLRKRGKPTVCAPTLSAAMKRLSAFKRKSVQVYKVPR